MKVFLKSYYTRGTFRQVPTSFRLSFVGCVPIQIFAIFFSSLYFYTSDSFRPIPALFTHFTLHQLFLVYFTTRNIFLIPDDAVARN